MFCKICDEKITKEQRMHKDDKANKNYHLKCICSICHKEVKEEDKFVFRGNLFHKKCDSDLRAKLKF